MPDLTQFAGATLVTLRRIWRRSVSNAASTLSLAPAASVRHDRPRTRREHEASRSAASAGFAPVLFASSVIGVLTYAWLYRDEGHITAETGLGYWLGIGGATIMLLLFLYPLRKRSRLLNNLGSVTAWFRVHMIFGVIGPAMIVLHSNFKLGSLNSSLALTTMLTVVASGIVGRFLYGRIHRGYSGAKIAMHDLIQHIATLETQLSEKLGRDAGIIVELHALSEKVSAPQRSLGRALHASLVNGWRISRARRSIRPRARKAIGLAMPHVTRRERRAHARGVDHILSRYFLSARRASRLMLFERLFRLWHAFHLPLFILLVLTSLIHIVAVHLY